MKEHEEDLGPTKSPAAIRWTPVLFIAAVVAVFAAVLWPRPLLPRSDQGSHHPAVGAQIEEVSLQPLTESGSDLTIEDVAGKVCLINFWGPWCGPCGIEFPHIADLERKFHDKSDFLFLSVSCSGKPGDETAMRDSTVAFLKQQRAKFPVYRDADARTRSHLMQAARLGGIEHFGYPTTVVLGRDGRIRGLWQGYAPGDELAMLDVVQTALQDK